ncbi:MAG: glycosyltransferase family 39 protein, partial [Anaerolineales bacterium]|nr:glycosyltransferase family 39 protein [Anaerolineales bacterium]
GISAVAFIKGDTNNIFRMGWYSFPSFHSWLQSIPIRIIGQTTPALRLSSVLAGSLTVGALYLVARALMGPRAGLYAAIFLSAHHFHHNFSRIGLNNIWDGLWYVVVLGALWVGWQREKRWAFILSGLALGFAQFFYVSARLLIPLVIVWLLISGFSDRPRFKRLWPDLVWLAGAALVVVMPLAGYYAAHPDEYFAPMVRVSIMNDWLLREAQTVGKPGWLILLQQVGLSFLALVHTPLRHWYTPGVPLLRIPSAILFLLGLGTAFLKPRDSRFHLLGLWILAICIPGGLSESVPAAQRYVALAPALALLVGYGLDHTAQQIGQLWPRFQKYIHGLAFLAILVIGLGELQFYYFEYTPSSEFGGANSLVAQNLADTLAEKPNQVEVLFWGAPRMGYYSIPSLQYLVPEIKGLDMTHPWGSAQNPQPTSDELIFVLLPDHEGELAAIQADFPVGSLVQEFDRNGHTLYWLYEVTPEVQSSTQTEP